MIWVKLLFILQFKMAIAPSWNILFKKSDVRMKNRAGESALETAIRMGDVQIQNVIFAACEAGTIRAARAGAVLATHVGITQL